MCPNCDHKRISEKQKGLEIVILIVGSLIHDIYNDSE